MMMDPTINEAKMREIEAARKKMMDVSYFKYGEARENFTYRVDAIGSAEMCIEKYKRTHNLEYLYDALNYIEFRILFPWQDDFFKPTDSNESAGTDGTPINMERGEY